MLPVLSGVLLSLGTATFDIGFFAWIGLVPLLFFLGHPSVGVRQALLGGLFAGSLYGFSVLWPLLTLNAWWWVNPHSFWFLHREAFLFGVIMLVSILAGGLFVSLFSFLYFKLHCSSFVDVIAFPMLWMVFERGREFFVAGFTWGQLGYNVHDYILALQTAKLFGVYGTSGVIVATNILVYLALRRFSFRNKFILILLLFIITLNVSGYLVVRANNPASDTLKATVVHSPLSTQVSGSFETYAAQLVALERILEASPQVIVLPENVFPFFVLDKRTLLPQKYGFREIPIGSMFDALSALSTVHPGTSLIFGVHTTDGTSRFNSLAVMERGVIAALYDKQQLLPLAEQVPESFVPGHVEPLSKGESTSITLQGKVPIAPLICSEIIYPRAIQNIERGIIVNISNDGVFDSPVVARQNHILAKFRAAEQGKYMLRSTKEGITSIIDPYGRVVTATSTDTYTELSATVLY
jgi:apolipoprotein N-acyltransferase